MVKVPLEMKAVPSGQVGVAIATLSKRATSSEIATFPNTNAIAHRKIAKQRSDRASQEQIVIGAAKVIPKMPMGQGSNQCDRSYFAIALAILAECGLLNFPNPISDDCKLSRFSIVWSSRDIGIKSLNGKACLYKFPLKSLGCKILQPVIHLSDAV